VLNTAHSGFVAYDLPGATGARILWGTGRGSYLRDGNSTGDLPPVVLGPDLIASWQQLTVAGPDRKGLYKVRGSITVAYQGNEESGACLMRLYYPDGAKMILKRAIKLKKLKAGQNATVKVNANKLTLVTGSSTQFTAVVDADGAIAETHEDNNRTLYTNSLP
jgi:hypothetical protein